MTLFSPYLFWGISIAFVLFQFFLQLSSGVIVNAITQDFSFTASTAGFLASAYYYSYTLLQLPVGMLFDRISTRTLLATTAALCGLSCLFFAYSHTFFALMLWRFFMGGSSAFAFIGVTHILRHYFPPAQFGFMIGLSETLAFLTTVLFMFLMGSLAGGFQWRTLMLVSGLMGFVIGLLCLLLPKTTETPHLDASTPSLRQACVALGRNPIAWLNGLYVGLGFGFITIFGAMWAIPFIQLRVGCSLPIASVLDALIFLGAGISCPLFGLLDARLARRQGLLALSYGITALLFLGVLWGPVTGLVEMGLLLFLMGLSCGAYMLSYTIANEITPPKAEATSTGFTNTLAVITAPLLTPVVGFLLDWHQQGTTLQLLDYQIALLLIPVSLFIGAGLAFWLPNKAGSCQSPL